MQSVARGSHDLEVGPEALTKEELFELRAAMLTRENLRLQMVMAERDLADIRVRLEVKYGPGIEIRTDTGAITRPA